MSVTVDPGLVRRLERRGQGHVFRFASELSEAERESLAARVEGLDLDLVDELARLARADERSVQASAAAARFEPPRVFRPRADPERARELRERGATYLRTGAVAYLLVAGGQASRLGYDGPKGAFPVGPVSRKSLFELFAQKLVAARRRYGVATPWYVLTSEANDEATRAFFEEHDFFGLERGDVWFMRQAMLPAFDDDGRILLAEKGELFLAPNGHGGVLAALASSGALDDAKARGVRTFSYFQVDNPLVPPADPLFLGLHVAERAQMSSKVVPKRDAAEKVGVLGLADGKLTCIEYSDMPAALREERDRDGKLVFDAGNIAVHAIELAFVEELTGHGFQLPWHRARKQMKVVDERGEHVDRAGWKFETFVFDALTRATRTATLEVARDEEFSPVKNAEGADSPATVRADLCRLHARWVRRAGLALPPAGQDGLHAVEVDPRVASDEDEFVAAQPLAPRVEARGHHYTQP